VEKAVFQWERVWTKNRIYTYMDRRKIYVENLSSVGDYLNQLEDIWAGTKCFSGS